MDASLDVEEMRATKITERAAWRKVEIILTPLEQKVKRLREEFAEKKRHLPCNLVQKFDLCRRPRGAWAPERDAPRLVAEGSPRDAKRLFRAHAERRFRGGRAYASITRHGKYGTLKMSAGSRAGRQSRPELGRRTKHRDDDVLPH